mgnify:CR=1 FL=1
MRGDALVRAIERLDFGRGERQRSRVAAGVDQARQAGAAEFAAYVADDFAKWARLAKEAGLKAE